MAASDNLNPSQFRHTVEKSGHVYVHDDPDDPMLVGRVLKDNVMNGSRRTGKEWMATRQGKNVGRFDRQSDAAKHLADHYLGNL